VITTEVVTGRSLLEILSAKIGGFAIYLGIMLFFNLYLFFRGRRISKQKGMALTNTNKAI
jgi:F0F1-type ATP synthase assembly protein I